MRPDSFCGPPTTAVLIPPLLARRNVRPARDNKFVLSPRLGPHSHRNHRPLTAAPQYRQHLSWAPRKFAPTTFCSSDLAWLRCPPNVLERPPDPRLERSSRHSG